MLLYGPSSQKYPLLPLFLSSLHSSPTRKCCFMASTPFLTTTLYCYDLEITGEDSRCGIIPMPQIPSLPLPRPIDLEVPQCCCCCAVVHHHHNALTRLTEWPELSIDLLIVHRLQQKYCVFSFFSFSQNVSAEGQQSFFYRSKEKTFL